MFLVGVVIWLLIIDDEWIDLSLGCFVRRLISISYCVPRYDT